MDWFRQLSGLEIAYFVIACVGTLLLVIQLIFMIVGAKNDADLDTNGDDALNSHTDTGVSLFTMKGLTAFFAIGGWTGMVLLSYNINTGLSIGVSVATGLVAYVVVWLIMRTVVKLQENGTTDYATAVGKCATVYVSIPPKRSGRGKITLTLQRRFTEADAVTDEEEHIPVDGEVEIVGCAGDFFVVKRKTSD